MYLEEIKNWTHLSIALVTVSFLNWNISVIETNYITYFNWLLVLFIELTLIDEPTLDSEVMKGEVFKPIDAVIFYKPKMIYIKLFLPIKKH